MEPLRLFEDVNTHTHHSSHHTTLYYIRPKRIERRRVYIWSCASREEIEKERIEWRDDDVMIERYHIKERNDISIEVKKSERGEKIECEGVACNNIWGISPFRCHSSFMLSFWIFLSCSSSMGFFIAWIFPFVFVLYIVVHLFGEGFVDSGINELDIDLTRTLFHSLIDVNDHIMISI
jgi:hypothetical protein